jgi:hypothetical protein
MSTKSFNFLEVTFRKFDPRIFDTKGYNPETFVIYGEHKSHTPPPKSRVINHPVIREECKLLKIEKSDEKTLVHIRILDTVYFYHFAKIENDFQIVLQCQDKNCTQNIYLYPSVKGRPIILENPGDNPLIKTCSYKYLKKNDPRVYQIKSYDTKTFEFFYYHTCTGIHINEYYPPVSKYTLISVEKYQNKIPFYNRFTGNFKIKHDDRIYSYSCRGVKINFQFCLSCLEFPKCKGSGFLTPKNWGIFSKFVYDTFDKSHKRNKKRQRRPAACLEYIFEDLNRPEVFDIENYFCDSFVIATNHTCTHFSRLPPVFLVDDIAKTEPV